LRCYLDVESNLFGESGLGRKDEDLVSLSIIIGEGQELGRTPVRNEEENVSKTSNPSTHQLRRRPHIVHHCGAREVTRSRNRLLEFLKVNSYAGLGSFLEQEK